MESGERGDGGGQWGSAIPPPFPPVSPPRRAGVPPPAPAELETVTCYVCEAPGHLSCRDPGPEVTTTRGDGGGGLRAGIPGDGGIVGGSMLSPLPPPPPARRLGTSPQTMPNPRTIPVPNPLY